LYHDYVKSKDKFLKGVPIELCIHRYADFYLPSYEKEKCKMQNISSQDWLQNAVSNEFLKVFGLIIVLTNTGETILRPIGGVFGNGINDAIEEADRLYPNSKMKLLLDTYDYRRYFIPNGVSLDRVL